jgi:FdrA protein
MKKNDLLTGKPKSINAGLRVFSEALRDQKSPVIQMNWKPPAGGDLSLLKKLEKAML